MSIEVVRQVRIGNRLAQLVEYQKGRFRIDVRSLEGELQTGKLIMLGDPVETFDHVVSSLSHGRVPDLADERYGAAG